MCKLRQCNCLKGLSVPPPYKYVCGFPVHACARPGRARTSRFDLLVENFSMNTSSHLQLIHLFYVAVRETEDVRPPTRSNRP